MRGSRDLPSCGGASLFYMMWSRAMRQHAVPHASTLLPLACVQVTGTLRLTRVGLLASVVVCMIIPCSGTAATRSTPVAMVSCLHSARLHTQLAAHKRDQMCLPYVCLHAHCLPCVL